MVEYQVIVRVKMGDDDVRCFDYYFEAPEDTPTRLLWLAAKGVAYENDWFNDTYTEVEVWIPTGEVKRLVLAEADDAR